MGVALPSGWRFYPGGFRLKGWVGYFPPSRPHQPTLEIETRLYDSHGAPSTLASLLQTKSCLPQGRAGSCRESQYLPVSRVSRGPETVAPTTEGFPFLVKDGGPSGDHSASEVPDTVDLRLLQYTRTDSSLPRFPTPQFSLENPALSLGLTRLSSCWRDARIIFPCGPPSRGVPREKNLCSSRGSSLKEGRGASPGVPWRPLISHSRALYGPCAPAQRKDSKNWTQAHSYRPSLAWESFICKNKEQQQRDWKTQLGGGGASYNANGEDSAPSPARSPGSVRGCGQPGETPSHLPQEKKKTSLRHGAESKCWLVGDGKVQSFVRGRGAPRSAFACSDNPFS